MLVRFFVIFQTCVVFYRKLVKFIYICVQKYQNCNFNTIIYLFLLQFMDRLAKLNSHNIFIFMAYDLFLLYEIIIY